MIGNVHGVGCTSNSVIFEAGVTAPLPPSPPPIIYTPPQRDYLIIIFERTSYDEKAVNLINDFNIVLERYTSSYFPFRICQ